MRQRLRSAFISTDWAGAAATPASPAACDPVRRSLGAEESRIIPPLRVARRSFALTHDRTPRAGRGGGGAARARRHETGRVSRPRPPAGQPRPPELVFGVHPVPVFPQGPGCGTVVFPITWGTACPELLGICGFVTPSSPHTRGLPANPVCWAPQRHTGARAEPVLRCGGTGWCLLRYSRTKGGVLPFPYGGISVLGSCSMQTN